MHKPSTLRIHLALLFVSAVFGVNSVTAKIALREMNPLALVCIRISTAAIILLVLQHIFIKERVRSARDFLQLAFFSVFGIIINQTLFLKGLALTTAINATVLVTTIPVVTIVIAIIMRREKTSFRKIAGSLISFVGVILLLGAERIDLDNQFFVGNVLVFINAVSFGIYLVIAKDILKRYHPATVTTWTFVFGAIGILPFGVTQAIHLPYADISVIAWLCVAFLILFSSVIVYYINSWALQRTTSSNVAVYIYVQPIVATTLSTVTLGETLTWTTVFAALLIFAGVFIVSLKMREELKAETASQELDLVREAMALKED